MRENLKVLGHNKMRTSPPVFGTNVPVHPCTLRDALLPGPPIGETGPYLYLNEHEARNVLG